MVIIGTKQISDALTSESLLLNVLLVKRERER